MDGKDSWRNEQNRVRRASEVTIILSPDVTDGQWNADLATLTFDQNCATYVWNRAPASQRWPFYRCFRSWVRDRHRQTDRQTDRQRDNGRGSPMTCCYKRCVYKWYEMRIYNIASLLRMSTLTSEQDCTATHQWFMNIDNTFWWILIEWNITSATGDNRDFKYSSNRYSKSLSDRQY